MSEGFSQATAEYVPDFMFEKGPLEVETTAPSEVDREINQQSILDRQRDRINKGLLDNVKEEGIIKLIGEHPEIIDVITDSIAEEGFSEQKVQKILANWEDNASASDRLQMYRSAYIEGQTSEAAKSRTATESNLLAKTIEVETKAGAVRDAAKEASNQQCETEIEEAREKARQRDAEADITFDDAVSEATENLRTELKAPYETAIRQVMGENSGLWEWSLTPEGKSVFECALRGSAPGTIEEYYHALGIVLITDQWLAHKLSQELQTPSEPVGIERRMEATEAPAPSERRFSLEDLVEAEPAVPDEPQELAEAPAEPVAPAPPRQPAARSTSPRITGQNMVITIPDMPGTILKGPIQLPVNVRPEKPAQSPEVQAKIAPQLIDYAQISLALKLIALTNLDLSTTPERDIYQQVYVVMAERPEYQKFAQAPTSDKKIFNSRLISMLSVKKNREDYLEFLVKKFDDFTEEAAQNKVYAAWTEKFGFSDATLGVGTIKKLKDKKLKDIRGGAS